MEEGTFWMHRKAGKGADRFRIRSNALLGNPRWLGRNNIKRRAMQVLTPAREVPLDSLGALAKHPDGPEVVML